MSDYYFYTYSFSQVTPGKGLFDEKDGRFFFKLNLQIRFI